MASVKIRQAHRIAVSEVKPNCKSDCWSSNTSLILDAMISSNNFPTVEDTVIPRYFVGSSLLPFFFHIGVMWPERNAEGTYPTLKDRIEQAHYIRTYGIFGKAQVLTCDPITVSRFPWFQSCNCILHFLCGNCCRLSWTGVVQLMNDCSVSLYFYTVIFIKGFWLLRLTKVTEVRSKSLTDLFRSLIVDSWYVHQQYESTRKLLLLCLLSLPPYGNTSCFQCWDSQTLH